MIELVRDDGGLLVRQCANDSQVSHVAGGVDQRLLAAREGGQRLLEHLVFTGVASDQVRSATAHAVLHDRVREGTDYLGMSREAEIVVAGEVQRAARWHAARTPQVTLLEIGERG